MTTLPQRMDAAARLLENMSASYGLKDVCPVCLATSDGTSHRDRAGNLCVNSLTGVVQLVPHIRRLGKPS